MKVDHVGYNLKSSGFPNTVHSLDNVLLQYISIDPYISMFPQLQGPNIDLEALSGICG